MRAKISIVILFLFAGFIGRTQAQLPNTAGPSDTLVVVWSSGDPDVAEKSCLMYAHAAKKYNWFKAVILIVWGPFTVPILMV